MKTKTKLLDWICILLIETKRMAQNWAIQRKQFLKRGNCAQKEKSILMAMWNRDLIEFQLGYTPYVLRLSMLSAFWTRRFWLIPTGYYPWCFNQSANDHAGRSCSFQSLFCLDRPFGFSVHRDTHFCLSCPFRFSTYRVYNLFIF